jgi:hypothetical protein
VPDSTPTTPGHHSVRVRFEGFRGEAASDSDGVEEESAMAAASGRRGPLGVRVRGAWRMLSVGCHDGH